MMMAQTRILLVEDEGIVAEDLKSLLISKGYEVVGILPTGEKAVELVGTLAPDIILMDILLAGKIDGITASKQIREKQDIPVIYVTAFADSALLERVKATEPSGYILKPFNEPEIQSNIEIALYRHGIEKQMKNMQHALLRANEKLNLLSDITRHDILNQLTALLGYFELIDAGILKENDKKYYNRALAIAQVIQDLITFTREYQDIGIKSPDWQDIGSIIRENGRMFPLGNVTSQVENLEVFADPLLRKVFYNLIDNALKYADGMTEIRFSSAVHDGVLSIFCEDNGIGIAEADKKKIFQRGFGKHTGFGLFLCREILAITDGSIIENGISGKGARFEITIPKMMWRPGISPVQK